MLGRSGVHLVAVVHGPVIVGEDFVEVGDAAEQRFREIQFAGFDPAQDPRVLILIQHQTSLLRRGIELARIAEGAGSLAVRNFLGFPLWYLHGPIRAPGYGP